MDMEEIPAWKIEEVERLTKLLKSSPVVGVVDIEGIPALQMQQMRGKLRGSVNLTVSRNTLIERALDNIIDDRENIGELKNHLSGQTALVTTDINPFKLYNRMEDTKTNAPASGGEISPEDIKIKKGDTPFKPGPVVGDLQKAGIPAAIQGGKVVISKTRVVVEEGEEIPFDLAKMLTRLEIHPIIVGLDLRVAYEDGTLFDNDTLDIDPQEYVDNIRKGALSAFNLSINCGYTTKQNIKPMISMASRDALSLALNSDIIVDKTVKIKLAEAHRNMLSLIGKLDPEALDPELMKELGMETEEHEDEKEEVAEEETEKVEEDEKPDDEPVSEAEVEEEQVEAQEETETEPEEETEAPEEKVEEPDEEPENEEETEVEDEPKSEEETGDNEEEQEEKEEKVEEAEEISSEDQESEEVENEE
ncbi:MAG: 50S ribosomal protein L10 [Thermoplasmata archaeon]